MVSVTYYVDKVLNQGPAEMSRAGSALWGVGYSTVL